MGLDNIRPIERVAAAVKLNEIVNSDNAWQAKVSKVAERIGTILGQNPDIQKKEINKLVVEEIGLSNPQTLLALVKKKPDDAKLNHAVELFSQSTALAMLVSGSNEQQESLMSGDVLQVEMNLPRGLGGFGERVAKVMLPGEVVQEVTALNKILSGEKSEWERDADKLAKSTERIIKIIGDSPLDKDNIQVQIAKDVVHKLNRKEDDLRGKKPIETPKIEKANRDPELPRTKEEQLAFARAYLEKIESSGKTTKDYNIGAYASQLEEFAQNPEIFDEVAVEIRSRLKLHDSATLMAKANGYVKPPDSGGDPECPAVGLAVTLAEGLKHALDNQAITFFLKSNANGLQTRVAWDLYQIVNCRYREVLNGLNPNLTVGLKAAIDNDPDLGTIDATYFTDSNSSRKKIVDDFITSSIATSRHVDLSTAKKSWALAKNLAVATGENSVFNAAMAGNDEMAEDIYLKLYRAGRDDSGRPRGPQLTLKKIVGIGNSWLRETSRFSPYLSGPGIRPLYASDVVVTPNLVELPNGRKVKEGIEDGSYVYHFGVWWTGKIHPMRGLLTDRKPDPKQLIDLTFLQNAVDYFNKSDPDGSRELRKWWVAGVMDLAVSINNLNWSQQDLSQFKQFLTKERLSDKAGVFLSKEVWDQLDSQYKFTERLFWLEIKRLGRAIVNGFIGAK